MNSPTCSKCDCVKGCQSNPSPCPILLAECIASGQVSAYQIEQHRVLDAAIAQPKQPAISEFTIADLAMKHLGSYAEKDYDFAVAVIGASKVAQPEQQTDLQQQNQQLRDQNTALDLRCAEYAKAAQAGKSEPVAYCNGDALLSFKCGNELPLKLSEAKDGFYKTPLYTHPAPVRQPLIDTALFDIADDFKSQYMHAGTTFDEFDCIGFARSIEAAHGITTPKETT